jgi:competence protein ComEC
VHFIDVGQADAALVLCDGKAMLIDGGNKADSNLIYTYLKKHNITHLDYIIGTHGHEDHIGGIPGALQFATAGVVYCSVTSYNSKAFDNFKNAVKNRGLSITVPTVGTTFNLGSATCTILAVNTPDAKGNKPDANNSSIVMRIVYGNTSFLFTGDAEEQVEKAILNSGANIKSDVLKVGHHGSDTSTGYLWLRTIDPQYAVIPVGSGNPYNHPTEAVLSRLRDADVTTFRTDKQGDILCVSDGTNLTFTPSRNANINVYEKIGPNSTQS